MLLPVFPHITTNPATFLPHHGTINRLPISTVISRANRSSLFQYSRLRASSLTRVPESRAVIGAKRVRTALQLVVNLWLVERLKRFDSSPVAG